jgi:hypothetical protein
MTVRAAITRAARAIDHTVARRRETRRVLIEVRTPMNLVVLEPIWKQLRDDRRVDLMFAAEELAQVAPLLEQHGLGDRLVSRAAARWQRFDLALSADPWNAAVLSRCWRRVNFFHGVAGKYDLDSPNKLPLDFSIYDRVMFPNEDRLRRYVDQAVVRPERAVLVGFPKTDALVRGDWPRAEVLTGLGLSPSLPTILYAPTFSPASSLQLAGEDIVAALLRTGRNVIAKLHDRSMVPTAKYTGGVDWPARLARFESDPRFALARTADAVPLLSAADLLVTDHSTVGFEFALLDRPLIVFDAPDLKDTARIDAGKWAMLRSMADLVGTADDLPPAVERALHEPQRQAEARRQSQTLFAHAGTATLRALALIYELLDLQPQSSDISQTETAMAAALSAPAAVSSSARRPRVTS